MLVAETVFRDLFSAIVNGVYGPGARIPAERRLAEDLGVSRVSVREALRRLVDRGVIATRRGSGATVLPMHRWSAKALAPAFRCGLDRRNWVGLGPMLLDALALRRDLILPIVGRAALKLSPGKLDPAREALKSAWTVRTDPPAFVERDRRVLPIVLQAAEMFPSMWVLNSLADAYVEVMSTLAGDARVPESYLPANHAIFDALEARNSVLATERMARHLDRMDAGIVAALPKLMRGENS